MRLMLLAALLALIVWLLLARPTPQDLRRYMKRGALLAAAGLLVFAAVTGRLHWLFALIGSALPFAGRILGWLRLLPLLGSLHAMYRRARAAQGPSSGQRSTVNTEHLRMWLEHDSGAMDGEVLRGRFSGARLSALELAQLRELYDELAGADAQAAALLEAYLDRVHGERWREGRQQREARGDAGAGRMERAEALEILGLAEGAGSEEIIAAHRRLMQKLHPDRGGSTYLAAKINQAKDTLLQSS